MRISEKQKKAFMEQLYKNGDKELKRLFKHQSSVKGKILNEIANIMLIYTIENDVISMSAAEQQKEMQKLSGIINSYLQADAAMQIAIITKMLASTAKGTFRLYNYNPDKKVIDDIVKQHYKGKHFSTRVWDNENEVAKYMNKQMQDFVKGKVNVNQIKRNIDNTFNSGAYNAKRLTETEISRVHTSAFDRFCEETGVKKLKYNATFCNTCDDCKCNDGKIFVFGKHIEIPKHPCCHCYYDIVE